MVYTNYFASKVNNEGVPKIGVMQFKKMMNIIFLEGKIEGIYQEHRKNTEAPNTNIDAYELSQQIKELTGGLSPKDLYIQMYRG